MLVLRTFPEMVWRSVQNLVEIGQAVRASKRDTGTFIGTNCLCTYLPTDVSMSLFHAQTARPISTKFCTDLHTDAGKVLITSMTPPTPRVPQSPKPKQISGEKTFLYKKCI